MNKHIIIEPDYWGVLVQWVVLFGFLMIIILPGFLYKKLAKRFNKKGPLYFILGLGVGVVGLGVVHLYARLVNNFFSPYLSEKEKYPWLLSMYLLGYLFVWAAYRLTLAFFIKQEAQKIG